LGGWGGWGGRGARRGESARWGERRDTIAGGFTVKQLEVSP
jgi:hypothetical protein